MFSKSSAPSIATLNGSSAELAQLASLHGTCVIERIEDIDANVPWLLASNHHAALVKRYGNSILLSKNGDLYTSIAAYHAVDRAQRALSTEISISQDDIKINVCSPQVMNQLYRQVNAKNAPIKGVASINDVARTRTSAQQLVDALIENAVQNAATDIHIDVNQHQGVASIAFRVFGLLRPYRDHVMGSQTWSSKDVTEAMSAVINADAVKNNGAPKSFNPKEPLDACISMHTESGEKNIRYAQTPTGVGFKVVLRILPMDSQLDHSHQSLEHLGYPPQQAAILEEAALSSSGLVIVAGPTGSGKTTTLSVLIEQLPAHLAIYTYEDPIEYTLSNATQVPVRADHPHLNWVTLSKNSLRLDPDVIMFGELRDGVVATEIINAATTGHLVFTTLHTNSAIGCITRLHDLGISYARLAEPGLLKVLVFQRLLPTTCHHCSLLADQVGQQFKSALQERQITRLLTFFEEEKHQLRFANIVHNTCSHCQGTGIHGRVIVAETVEIDALARAYIASGDLAGWDLHLRQHGWQSIQAHAKTHVLAGRACPMITESILSERFNIVDTDPLEKSYQPSRLELL